VFVPFSKFLHALKVLFFRILFGIPETIAIPVSTTPHGFAGMVVKNDHETIFRELLNCIVKNFHGCFSVKLRVGFDELPVYGVVGKEHFERKGEPDTIEKHLLFEFLTDVIDFSELEPTDTVSFSMSPGPVNTSELDSPTRLIDDFHFVSA
jgi:hypothetical protein